MRHAPTFALVVTRMDGWYQGQVWHAAAAAAKLLSLRMVALVGSAYGDPHLRGGQSDIYELAGTPEVDGYLVLSATLANFTGVDPVLRLLEGLPPRPTVSVGLELPGVGAVLQDGGGMERIARHLIEAHGARRMAFIGGPTTNEDANRRWKDWMATLAEYGLEQDPDLVERGDFLPGSGEAAAERILSRTEKVPEAFVCANDAMALGVRRALAARRLRIPQDVLMTGYDDIDEARSIVPPLTTVHAGIFRLAFRGIELLLDIHRGGEARTVVLPTDIVLRRSCGCRAGASSSSLPPLIPRSSGMPEPPDLLRGLAESEATFLQRLEESLDDAEYGELDLWEENILAAARSGGGPLNAAGLVSAGALVSRARHSLDTRRRQSLQFLLRTQVQAIHNLARDPGAEGPWKDLLEAFRSFSENRLRILLFHADGSPLAEGAPQPTEFGLCLDTRDASITVPPARLLLPADDPECGTWAVLPVSLGPERYGVVQVRDWNSNELFLEILRLSLAMVLSGFRKARSEAAVREELIRLSRRDELTGLLNRRGLLEQGALLVHAAGRARKRIGVVLFDLDGLKEINDRHGHSEGDLAIRCLARALEDSFRQSDVIARMGGDEFAVVSLIEDEANLEGAIARLRSALDRRSSELGRPWTARTSAGWTTWDPGDGRTLEEVVALADGELYADKRSRKSGRS
jgi:diguanylate cyclase (GGDEF)-like protein